MRVKGGHHKEFPVCNKINAIKQVLISGLFIIFILAGLGTVAACADDRTVGVPAADDNHGDGGSSSTTTTTTDTHTHTTTDTSTGGLPVGENVEGWQVLSFNMYEWEAYDDFPYYADKAWGLLDCMADSDCVADAYYDVAGRLYQWLTTSTQAGSTIYDEEYVGLVKGYCVYKNATNLTGSYTVEAGVNCTNASGGWRECSVGGVVVVEQTDGEDQVNLNSDDTRLVGVAYGDGDSGATGFCFGSEHAVYIVTGGTGTMSYSQQLIALNTSLGVRRQLMQ